MEKKALLFMDRISTLYNIPLKELKKIWNNPKELIPKEKVIDFSDHAITDSWTGKPPSPLTVSELLEYMDDRPEYKEMVKLDISNNWLHAAGAATLLEYLEKNYPNLTHIDLSNNRINIEKKSDETAGKLASAIQRLVTQDRFVELNLSDNKFDFSWYYKLHSGMNPSNMRKVIATYSSTY
jgi:hypothetical protein